MKVQKSRRVRGSKRSAQSSHAASLRENRTYIERPDGQGCGDPKTHVENLPFSDAVLLPSRHNPERGVSAVVRRLSEHSRTRVAAHGGPVGR